MVFRTYRCIDVYLITYLSCKEMPLIGYFRCHLPWMNVKPTLEFYINGNKVTALAILFVLTFLDGSVKEHKDQWSQKSDISNESGRGTKRQWELLPVTITSVFIGSECILSSAIRKDCRSIPCVQAKERNEKRVAQIISGRGHERQASGLEMKLVEINRKWAHIIK